MYTKCELALGRIYWVDLCAWLVLQQVEGWNGAYVTSIGIANWVSRDGLQDKLGHIQLRFMGYSLLFSPCNCDPSERCFD